MKTGTYLSLQLKRSFKLLPTVLIIIILTVSALICVGLSFMKSNSESDTLLNVGITGDIEGSYVQIGIDTLKVADGSRFFANFIEIPSEEEALKLVHEGKLHGYLSVPDGYFEDIYHGVNTPATYVTLGNANGISNELLAEVTKTVSHLVTETQNGIYCMQDTVHRYKLDTSTRPYTTNLNIEYVKEILGRYATFEQEILSLPDSVSLGVYYVCAIIIILLLLWGIACHRLLDREGVSMSKLLNSRGLSETKQMLSEYVAYLAVTFAVVLFFAIIIGTVFEFADIGMPEFSEVGILEAIVFAFKMLPVIIMVSLMQFCFYELLGAGVGSITVQFLLIIGMSYISGLFYPDYIFPKIIRNFGALLPTGVCFSYTRRALNGMLDTWDTLPLILYALVFAVTSVLVKKKRVGD